MEKGFVGGAEGGGGRVMKSMVVGVAEGLGAVVRKPCIKGMVCGLEDGAVGRCEGSVWKGRASWSSWTRDIS